jgi:Putative Ig domain
MLSLKSPAILSLTFMCLMNAGLVAAQSALPELQVVQQVATPDPVDQTVPFTLTWPMRMPDINYTAVCTPRFITNSSSAYSPISAKAPSSVTVTLPFIEGTAAEINCLALHDSVVTDIRHARTSTVLVSNGISNVTLTWSTLFANTAYTAVCGIVMSPGGSDPFFTGEAEHLAYTEIAPFSKTQSSTVVTIDFNTLDNKPASAEVDCLGLPDSTTSAAHFSRAVVDIPPPSSPPSPCPGICTFPFPWSPVFSDTNYGAACAVMLISGSNEGATLADFSNKAPSQFTGVVWGDLGGFGGSVEVNCIAGPVRPTSSMSITTSSLPNGTVGNPYPGTTMAVTGGTAPYSWSAAGLPSGLSIGTSSGLISGTPMQSGTFTVTISVNDSTGLTASKQFPLTIDTCPVANVIPHAGGQNSNDGYPTSITASFTPIMNGVPVSLNAAAAACGVAGFDWKQLITNWPLPTDPSQCNLLSGAPLCLAAVGNPNTILFSPPVFSDPVFTGYTYDPVETALNYPFYYAVSSLPAGCAEYNEDGSCNLPMITNQNSTLNFFDAPKWSLLPSGGYMGFQTRLVGVLSDGTVGRTFTQWNWRDTYKPSILGGSSGGIQTLSFRPVDGNGTGGVTITSINDVPQTPPVVTCTATPNILWPPNGNSVLVTVSGTLTAGTSALTSTTYAVLDEYGQVQPSGNITLGAGGSYSFAVPLIASRNGYDLNGRTYTIRVGGTDSIGNVGLCSAIVTVPHDQGQ